MHLLIASTGKVKGWHCLSIKHLFLWHQLFGVIFHMVKKKTSSRKTCFMTFGNFNLNGLLGLRAAGISIFFIDNVPLVKPFGGQITLNFEAVYQFAILEKTW